MSLLSNLYQNSFKVFPTRHVKWIFVEFVGERFASWRLWFLFYCIYTLCTFDWFIICKFYTCDFIHLGNTAYFPSYICQTSCSNISNIFIIHNRVTSRWKFMYCLCVRVGHFLKPIRRSDTCRSRRCPSFFHTARRHRAAPCDRRLRF